MIQIKNSVLLSPEFKDAAIKIATSDKFSASAALEVSKLLDALNAAYKAIRVTWADLLHKYVVLGDDGVYKTENGELVWLEGVDPVEAEANIFAFGNVDTDIDHAPMEVSDFELVGLTPSELKLLYPIFQS